MSSKIALPGLTRNNATMAPQSKSLANGKNPFHNISNWTPEQLSQISVEVSEPVETTNDFTRAKQKAARYWSSDVTFFYTDPESQKEFKSGIIKMSDNDIPRVDSLSYGTDFFYATCNKAIGDAIVAAAGKKNISATVDDEKTVSNANQWWKTINKAKGRIGVLDSNGSFQARDLHGIMVKTEAGIKASLDISVKLKYNNKDGSNRKPNSQFRIVTDLSRGFIKRLRNDVQPPPIESSVETAPAVRADIATEDLLSELDSLEL